MATEIGLFPCSNLLFKQCLGVSYSNMQMHAGISVSFPVLIASVKKHCGNSAGMYMWLSQLTLCFAYLYLTSSIQDSFESAVFYQSWKYVSGTIHNFLI